MGFELRTCRGQLGWLVKLSLRSASFRFLAAVVAGAVATSGCVTTMAVSPPSVAAAAGLPEDKEGQLRTPDGPEDVDGSTRVTLHSTEAGTETTNEVALSKLRSENGALVLPGDGHRLTLSAIWGAEVANPSAADVAPSGLLRVAGLAEGREASLHTWPAPVRVTGSTLVTLHSAANGTETTNALSLSKLRSDGDALVLPGDSHVVALSDVWSAEIVKPSPGKTAGLVVGIVLGVAALAAVVVVASAVNAFSNSFSNSNSGGDAALAALLILGATHH